MTGSIASLGGALLLAGLLPCATPARAGEQVLDGAQDRAGFGWSVACVGDLNGDGYGDVLVGAPDHVQGNDRSGRAFLYLGTSTGISTSPAWSWSPSEDGAEFGWAVAGGADVNGDGSKDVVIGSPGHSSGGAGRGAAYLFLGGNTTTGLASSPEWTLVGSSAGDELGRSVAIAPSLGGDSKAEVVVGAPGSSAGAADEGAVLVYYGVATGSTTSLMWSETGPAAGSRLGTLVVALGDVTGDGRGDLGFGMPMHSGTNGSHCGRVDLYYNSSSGFGTSPSWSVEGDKASAFFGNALVNAGLVAGPTGSFYQDAYPDLVVGTWARLGTETSIGRLSVFLGTGSGVSTTAWQTIDSPQGDAQLGYALASAGLWSGTGDTRADVLVTGPLTDGTSTADLGAATILAGAATGLGSPLWTGTPSLARTLYGHSAAMGKIDSDSKADIVVGAPWGKASSGRVGSVHVICTTP